MPYCHEPPCFLSDGRERPVIENLNSLETRPSSTTFTLLGTEDTEPNIGRLVDYQQDGEED
jgi:hypothetical protein